MGSPKTDTRGVRLCWIAPLMAALLMGSASAAPPLDAWQPSDGPAADDAADVAAGSDDSKVAPLPWNQLNPTQRAMLAPLQSQWDQLPPRRQQRMAARAEHWMQLPPERRAQIQQRITRWAQMTPEQRREAAHGEQAFRAMPEADRQRVLDAYRRFQSLSPAQRRMLMQRFRDERRARQGMGEPEQRPPQR